MSGRTRGYVVGNMGKAVGESLIEALGKQTPIPTRLDEVKVGVSESGLVGRGVPLCCNEL